MNSSSSNSASKPQSAESKKRFRAAYFREYRLRKKEDLNEILCGEDFNASRVKQASNPDDISRLRDQERSSHHWKKNGRKYNETRQAKRRSVTILQISRTQVDLNVQVTLIRDSKKIYWVQAKKKIGLTPSGRDQWRRALNEPFSFIKSAQERFNELVLRPEMPEHVKSLVDYGSIIERIERDSALLRSKTKREQKLHSFKYVPMKLAFVFAYYLHRRFRDPNTKNAAKGVTSQFQTVLNVLGNRDLPRGYFLSDEAEEYVRKLAEAWTIGGRSKKDSTFRRTCREMRNAFDLIAKNHLVFRHYGAMTGFSAHLRDHEKRLVKAYRKSSHSTGGTIQDHESHPPLSFEQLDAFLVYLGEYDLSLLNGVILSLSTCVRVEEIERLIGWINKDSENQIKDRASILSEDSYLNYKAGWIVQKTEAKVDPKRLNNPRLSIVSRIIFNGDEPCRFFRPAEVNTKGVRSIRVKESRFQDFYQRRLRCTGATMLAFCEKTNSSEFLRTTMADVQDRCGHADRATTERYYARRQASQVKSPEKFFKFEAPDLFASEGDGLLKDSTVWDAYLLRYFVKFALQACPNDDVRARKKREYRAMAIAYQKEAT